MPKQTPLRRELFIGALIRLISRVFFAIVRSLLLAPVIFYTRARIRVYTRMRGMKHETGGMGQLHGVNTSHTPYPLLRAPRFPKRVTLVLVLALAICISLSATLIHPAAAVTNGDVNFQARLEGSDG